MSDFSPTSFDSLAHERNLSPRLRDVMRLVFLAALSRGRGRGGRSLESIAREHNMSASTRALAREVEEVGERIGREQARAISRPYHHVLDRDTAPGEFR